jgi:hypothetical protein
MPPDVATMLLLQKEKRRTEVRRFETMNQFHLAV